LGIDDFDSVSGRTPILADLKPGGRYVAVDMDRAGGSKLLGKRMLEAGLLAGAWLNAFGLAVILEATFNFLDMGLLPLIPSWGGDLKANLPYLHVNPAIVLFPGMAVVIAALGFHLMAESVRKHTTPHV
jgi:ABC-type antimicrobial peptide transport system permease subunit